MRDKKLCIFAVKNMILKLQNSTVIKEKWCDKIELGRVLPNGKKITLHPENSNLLKTCRNEKEKRPFRRAKILIDTRKVLIVTRKNEWVSGA